MDGNISDCELTARKFTVGASIQSKSSAKEILFFKIVKIQPNFEDVILEAINAYGEPIGEKQSQSQMIGHR